MIKEVRDIESNELKGYVFNGTYVPLDKNNRHYKEIQKLVREGKETIIPAFTDEERLNYFKNSRIERLLKIADRKTKEIEDTLAGFVLSPGQVERYETKYNKALEAINNNDYSWFNAEATLLGMDPKDLALSVKENYEAAKAKVDEAIKLIEAYRVKAKQEINQLTEIKYFKIIDSLLDYAETITSIVEDDLIALFNKYGDVKARVEKGEDVEAVLKDIDWSDTSKS